MELTIKNTWIFVICIQNLNQVFDFVIIKNGEGRIRAGRF
jgi:hypothetical protein